MCLIESMSGMTQKNEKGPGEEEDAGWTKGEDGLWCKRTVTTRQSFNNMLEEKVRMRKEQEKSKFELMRLEGLLGWWMSSRREKW